MFLNLTAKANAIFIAILFMVGLSACTSKELYNHTKAQVKAHCNLKVGVEKEQCLEQINTKSYEEYEAERQEVIKGK
jgi:hypothetical protein